MALIDKLIAIADGFRASRGLTEELSLDRMAELASEEVGGGGATEPYMEETYDAAGNLIDVNMIGYTKIREFAFYGCSNLALTSLPEGITSIGNSAFCGCSNLALTSLPEGITSIGNYVFYGCSNLALTSLPEGITSIGNSAFYSCSNLALTYIPYMRSTTVLDGTFTNCKKMNISTVPDNIESIRNSALRNTGIINFTVPANTKLEGYMPLGDNEKLESVTFLGTPSTIVNNAFHNCSNLTTINVPWAEGAVANAPWGATNATINYNYTEEVT